MSEAPAPTGAPHETYRSISPIEESIAHDKTGRKHRLLPDPRRVP